MGVCHLVSEDIATLDTLLAYDGVNSYRMVRQVSKVTIIKSKKFTNINQSLRTQILPLNLQQQQPPQQQQRGVQQILEL